MSAQRISVIGGGLAGCAAALAAQTRGARVDLYEQRPATSTHTHQTALPAELAGTADLGVNDPERATGLLKAELRMLCPALMECADATRIGEQSLAVDREAFAHAVAERVGSAEGIELRREQLAALPDGPVVIASGPSTWSPLARAIHAAAGTGFRFSFIGRPPLIAAESIDLSEAFHAPIYPGAEPALFVPLSEDEAAELATRLATAERHEPPEFSAETILADESTTAERMAADPSVGLGKLLSGPRGPQTGHEGLALCLTPDDADGRAWHAEGLLTTLSPEDQVEALGALRAFANVRLVRPALVQRSPWLAGPDATLATLQLRRTQRALITGTLTGVYGYVEAMTLGAVAGIGAVKIARGAERMPPPGECLTGALCQALANEHPRQDRRMLRANFGMIGEHRDDQGLNKSERRKQQIERALKAMRHYVDAG